MYVLCAPHLEIGGWHNNGEILQIGEYKFLIAHKGSTWLAIGATAPFTEASCGYVGVNDGWTDLADNYRLDWQYEEALDGNIALTGGLVFLRVLSSPSASPSARLSTTRGVLLANP
jgi:glucoamylase